MESRPLAIRRRRAVPIAGGLVILALLCGLAACSSPREEAGGATDPPTYREEIDAWHAQRIERLRSETGWLTLVGLCELAAGENAVGSDPAAKVILPASAPARTGVILVDDGGARWRTAAGAAVTSDDAAVTELALASDAAGEPTVLETGSVLFYVIDRGGRLFVRVKDRDSEVRRGFAGIERFPVDPRWRVTARLEPVDEGATVDVANALGQVEPSPTPGALVFELAGRTCRLHPIGEPGESLFLVFGDATSGVTTYGGGRFLSADAPDSTGAVVLDFNQATNPPCVFTPYATCPLPPEGNVLPLAVEAGEKMWGEQH